MGYGGEVRANIRGFLDERLRGSKIDKILCGISLHQSVLFT